MIRELKQRLEAEHHGRKRKKIIVERNLLVTPLAMPGGYLEAPAGKRFVIEYVGADITQTWLAKNEKVQSPAITSAVHRAACRPVATGVPA